jgi:hypothetical protein
LRRGIATGSSLRGFFIAASDLDVTFLMNGLPVFIGLARLEGYRLAADRANRVSTRRLPKDLFEWRHFSTVTLNVRGPSIELQAPRCASGILRLPAFHQDSSKTNRQRCLAGSYLRGRRIPGERNRQSFIGLSSIFLRCRKRTPPRFFLKFTPTHLPLTFAPP